MSAAGFFNRVCNQNFALLKKTNFARSKTKAVAHLQPLKKFQIKKLYEAISFSLIIHCIPFC